MSAADRRRALMALKAEMRAALEAEKDRRKRKIIEAEYEEKLKTLIGPQQPEESATEKSPSVEERRGGEAAPRISKSELKKERRRQRELEERQSLVDKLGETDFSGREEERLNGYLPPGAEVVEIKADGSCLFHAIAHQLNAVKHCRDPATITRPVMHTANDVRMELAAFIRLNREEYSMFLETPLDEFCSQIEQGSVFGGEIEIRAANQCYGCDIEVYTENGVIKYSEGSPRNTMRLCYLKHKYATPHYNAIIVPNA
ncbi:putative OTU-like cysteine protease [Gregarina niphandrodes]|uniref:OTU-like cysteine protease n=1 Tax=Gregarina niphandrodes TaxID=110365 RepID=A0A023BD78_GRENI|nr:putative OTU-like cysteine protease [Gregarina niphandrodes]EZG87173.1 putative OTU-like cysteine protease [Gregarina niphandrodes]|eukprot:XP_011128692.1 putative OTU-like cysteine protease [Gregarina niphandrodes]